MNAMNQRALQRRDWQVRKFENHDEMRNQQIRDWQACSGAERRQAAWELARDFWVDIEGKSENELRLQRSVGSFRSGRS